MSENVIRASDIAAYVYCRRAWWLRRRLGRQPANVRELQFGQEYHRQHGAAVGRASKFRRIALTLLLVAAGLVVYSLMQLL